MPVSGELLVGGEEKQTVKSLTLILIIRGYRTIWKPQNDLEMYELNVIYQRATMDAGTFTFPAITTPIQRSC